jgi:hypothetical protein
MSDCPKCNTPVPDSAFGLYTCAECKSVLTVGFNGEVSFDDIAPAAITSSNVSQEVQRVSDSSMEQESEEPSITPEYESMEVSPVETPEDRTMVLQKPSPPDLAEPFELAQTKRSVATSDFQDVIKYANSSESAGQEGSLLYDVLVKGIDSEDLRLAVKEALIDVRFGWDAQAVYSKLRGGSILLSRINSVKASILVSRLKSYPLEISWKQNGIYEVES